MPPGINCWQIARYRLTAILVKAGDKTMTGDDLAAYFTWPIKNSAVTSVAVVGGSGLKGMKAADANQYFAGGSGFPDFMIFRLGMLNFRSEGSSIGRIL